MRDDWRRSGSQMFTIVHLLYIYTVSQKCTKAAACYTTSICRTGNILLDDILRY